MKIDRLELRLIQYFLAAKRISTCKLAQRGDHMVWDSCLELMWNRPWSLCMKMQRFGRR